MEDILRSVVKRNLLPPEDLKKSDDKEEEESRAYRAIVSVRDYLERTLRVRLFSLSAFIPGKLGLFALYSNHNIRKYQNPKTVKSKLEFMMRAGG